IIGKLLYQKTSQFIVADINWAVFENFFKERTSHSFFETLDVNSVSESNNKTAGVDLSKLKHQSEKKRIQFISELIKAEVEKVLGYENEKLPDALQGFIEMGMDSISAINLKNNLEK